MFGGVEVLIFLLVYVVFWVGIVFGASYFAVRLALSRTSLRVEPDPGTALETLRERYARGDISREEFEQMRRDLE